MLNLVLAMLAMLRQMTLVTKAMKHPICKLQFQATVTGQPVILIIVTLCILTVLIEANGDGTFTIKFDWSTATAETSMTFLTSKILGTVKKRGMGCYLRHALKILSKVKPPTAQSLFFQGLLKAGQKALANAANKGTELTRHFKTAFDSNKELFVRAMTTYVLGQPVRLYSCEHPSDDGRLIPQNHLPKHQDLNALARVIVLMSDPEVQTLWHSISNEDRTRQAVDDRNATRAVTNDKLETQLLDDYFNNSTYKAPHSVNLSPYAPSVQLDPTAAPTPAKSLQWFREQRRWAKVVMGCIQTRFARKTGGGEMGADGADADTVFFNYCRGDLLVMFLWLHWERGTNVPAHCTAVLEEESRVDIGGGKGGRDYYCYYYVMLMQVQLPLKSQLKKFLPASTSNWATYLTSSMQLRTRC